MRLRRRGELDLPKCVGATPLGLTLHLVGVPRVEATLGFGTKPLRGNKTENLDCLDCLDLTSGRISPTLERVDANPLPVQKHERD